MAFPPARARLAGMVWIIALLCMGLTGLAGYRRGAICAVFSLLGVLAGLLLAGPLSPLASRLLPALGFQNPLWQFFIPAAIAFLAILGIFKIAGNAVHQKMTLRFKYDESDDARLSWERLHNRLGFCVGVLNGAFYFFILMLPVYVAGYFTTEAAGVGADASLPRLLTTLRAGLHDSRLDRVVAAHDPLPPAIYQAADLVDLLLRNPPLARRLSLYPPLLVLSRQKEIQDLASDPALKEMIQKQATVGEFLNHPKIQAIVTNPAVSGQIRSLLEANLGDLREFLNTGKSPRFDSEKILGVWDIDVRASWDGERSRHPDMTRNQIAALNTSWVPAIAGFSLMATPDNQVLLQKQGANRAPATTVAKGTWKMTDNACQITLPNNKPDTVAAIPADDGTLQLPRDGHILIFNKEL